jgi:hypothetical protein
MVDVKLVGLLSLAGGVGVLLGTYTRVLGNLPLVLIGGALAVVAGLLGLFKGV